MNVLSRLKNDDLIRHSAIMFSSLMIVHACSIVFQMVTGRILPKEEFALLAAFLGILAILQRPLSTLQTAVCHYGSLLEQQGRSGDVKRMLRKWLLLTAAPSLLIGLLTMLASAAIADYFHLTRSAPVIITGAVLPALCWRPIVTGAAQGLQRFRLTAVANIVFAVVRLGLGAGFVYFLYPFCGWAMLGHGLSVYTAAGIILIGLWFALHGKKSSNEPLPSMRLYLLQSFFVLAAYAVLMTADVVLVKRYVPGDTEFAYAATMARMVAFLPGAIVLAMFPKVSSAGEITDEQRLVFRRSLLYTLFCVAASVLVCALIPGLLAKILYGGRVIQEQGGISRHLRWMIPAMAAVMGLSALLNVTTQFLLAQRRFRACAPVIVCAVLYLLGCHLFHSSAWFIVLFAGGMNALALVMTGVAALRH